MCALCIFYWVFWPLVLKVNWRSANPCIIFFCIKGNRFAMPLSRIALQSPAGSARGQVMLSSVWDYCYHQLSNLWMGFLFYANIIWKFFQADDIRNEANELLRIRDYLFNELANKTGQPVEKVSSLNDGYGDKWVCVTCVMIILGSFYHILWLHIFWPAYTEQKQKGPRKRFSSSLGRESNPPIAHCLNYGMLCQSQFGFYVYVFAVHILLTSVS